ncbi:putative ubiquitin-like protein YukD [Microbacterium resistens]|uniref:Ubiquitin-like protein YukD n=1 Tax=Microbacterium resistens TaxID=156977 RepID=A0ABU1S7C8_9MICO|nr:hypothetical protein [Microbacterium resistens]MDR6865513.1 putative ubiquitin-like protein YukD [Microbacterium resistens]
MIEITLEYIGKHIDLLVPGGITFDRLTQLIRDGFAAKGTMLPEGLSLLFKDKAFAVSGCDVISSFGIGNGDRLQIVAIE